MLLRCCLLFARYSRASTTYEDDLVALEEMGMSYTSGRQGDAAGFLELMLYR